MTSRKITGPLRWKNWLGLPVGVLLLGLLFPFFSCSAHSDSGRMLTIVYANRINGQLDPCG